jgi:hypothetical protein
VNRDKLTVLYKKYQLEPEDVFKHKHYLIISRTGIDKIQAIEQISLTYEVVNVEPEFCVVKAIALKGDVKIETFGSAKYGKADSGNTTTWYVMEMAEKRAMSRAVLKITGFYELGVYGEDESEQFKRSYNRTVNIEAKPVNETDDLPTEPNF